MNTNAPRLSLTATDQTESILWPRFLTKLRVAFSLDSTSGPDEQNMVSLQANITRSTNPSPFEETRLRKIVDTFPPRSVADFLIYVCIRHGTDVVFYFDQVQVMNEIDQFYANPSCPLRFDPSFICLALTVFAFGSHWTPLERPQNSSRIEECDPGPCFILGVYLMPFNAVGSSYIYMGMALRKALAFNLAQDPEDHALDEREREIRRCLWWSIYSLERCTTIKLNRPRSVPPDIIKAPLPSPLQELDNSQKFNNVLLQIAYARLISILDLIADWESTVMDTTKRAESTSIENQLRQRRKSLPEEFDLESIYPQDSRYRAVFHIYLNYYYARIVMGEEVQQLIIDETVKKLSKPCTKASKKLLQLFEDLTQTGNTRFSFTDF